MTKNEFVEYLMVNSRIGKEKSEKEKKDLIEKKIDNFLVAIFNEYNSLFNPNPNVDPFKTITTLKQLYDIIQNFSEKYEEIFSGKINKMSGGGAQYLRHYKKKLKNEDKTENNQKDEYEEKIEEIISEFSRRGKGVKTKTMKTTGGDKVRKNDIHQEGAKSVKAASYAELLKNAYNIILHGAPGTGKTYLAHKIAREMGCDENRIKMVQFHPSYDYTVFMEGLRPKNENGNIGFERRDGSFKEFCKKAISDSESKHKYVFIIDEINRGEIAKILGECMFSIDPGYVGDKYKLETQYQNLIDKNDKSEPFNQGFYRPDNLFIIGTMNDIDRGVESMDLAMRRRFVFVEIKAEETQEEILNNLDNEADKKIAIKAMNNLNNMINGNDKVKGIEGLGEDYCIGASYFLKIKDYGDREDKWDLLWNYHLKGLLKEYLRGREDAENSLEELENIYKNAVENKGGQVKDAEALETNLETNEA